MPYRDFSVRVAERLTRLCDRVCSERAGAGERATATANGLLVGLSGGPDSVALLLAAHEWASASQRPLAAAHLNHRLRGGDADRDERFCRDLCDRLEVPLHVKRSDPRPLSRRRSCGLEEAGRVLRRRYFAELLDVDSALLCVATGHHRDDQSETVLMRLFRGTGLDGLRAIRPVCGRTIHPLLAFRRREIIDFLEARGQPYRFDVTNDIGANTRSRVRHELLPLARDIFGTGADEAPARLTELIEEDATWLDANARERFAALSRGGTLAISGLLALPRAVAQRVIRLQFATVVGAEIPEPSESASGAADQPLGSPVDLELRHVNALLAWLKAGQSGQSLDLPSGVRAVREFDRLRFEIEENGPSSVSTAASYRILVKPALSPQESKAAPPENDTGAETQRRQSQDRVGQKPTDAARDRWRLCCPRAALRGRLRLRNWRAGDRIELPGLDGHKKVSDLLRERRIPVSERAGVLVVEDDAGILWVVGHAHAARARLLPADQPAVTISVVARRPDASASAADRR